MQATRNTRVNFAKKVKVRVNEVVGERGGKLIQHGPLEVSLPGLPWLALFNSRRSTLVEFHKARSKTYRNGDGEVREERWRLNINDIVEIRSYKRINLARYLGIWS